MPRYYSTSTESIAEVACSVTCCCIWMVCVVFTIVPGFLLVVIGCPCSTETFRDELCIDCAIIGDILLSIGGSVMIVGFIYYCCNNFLLRKASEPPSERQHINRVPKATGTPSVSFNPSCQLHTYEVNENPDFQSSNENQNRFETTTKEQSVNAKDLENKMESVWKDKREARGDFRRPQPEMEAAEVSLVEAGSFMSSLFSDTVVNVSVENEVSSESR